MLSGAISVIFCVWVGRCCCGRMSAQTPNCIINLQCLVQKEKKSITEDTHSNPMDIRCWPMRRTISWSVVDIREAGVEGCRSPFCAASPLRCGEGAPLVAGGAGGCGWCMARCGGDSLRVRLRGGRWPAPSSPESLEARLARAPRRPRRELTRAPAASASLARPSDVTAYHCARPQWTISLCSSRSTGPVIPELRCDALRFPFSVREDEWQKSAIGSVLQWYTKISWKRSDSCLSSLCTTSPFVSDDVRAPLGRASGELVSKWMTSKIKYIMSRNGTREWLLHFLEHPI